MEDNQNTFDPDENSLEGNETVAQQASVTSVSGDGENLNPAQNTGSVIQGSGPQNNSKKSIAQKIQSAISKINIYLLLFGLILLLAGIATFASFRASKNSANQSNINGQTLSAEDLKNLKNNDATVGDSRQTLTIASNSIFNGRVLVKDNLDVAGTIRVGGELSLPGITVSGTSAFENVQIGNDLSIAGNTSVQGTLTVQKSLSVRGGANFAGTVSAPTISTDQLILNQDIQVNRHIEVGGATPRVTSMNPGSGGAVSINGSDTAGTVSIAFGAGSGGGLARVTFASRYNQTPHVIITPNGRQCASLRSYVDEVSTTSFVIGIDASGSAGSRCSFDFIVFD
jgi:cytoskeletal protein CcmA (bactofilin family)